MACTSLNDVKLKVIDLTKSHAAQAKTSKDNFAEIEKYINNNRCRIAALEGATTSTVNTTIIKNTVRNDMIKVAELKTTHVDGTTVTQANGVSVTRSGNNFVIQKPDAVPILLHALRDASTKQFASAYKISMDASNQVTIYFSPFIKQNMELILFG